jgi:hypothetical protein
MRNGWARATWSTEERLLTRPGALTPDEPRLPREAGASRPSVLARVALLLAAMACLLIGIRFAPNIEIGVIGHPTATLVNDSGRPVLVSRCVTSCADRDTPVDLAAGRSLRLEPGSAAEWVVEDSSRNRIGCFTIARESGKVPGTFYVSRAGPCRT